MKGEAEDEEQEAAAEEEEDEEETAEASGDLSKFSAASGILCDRGAPQRPQRIFCDRGVLGVSGEGGGGRGRGGNARKRKMQEEEDAGNPYTLRPDYPLDRDEAEGCDVPSKTRRSGWYAKTVW